MKKMAISYMTSDGNGYYPQRRIPKDLLPHYPGNRSGIIKRYLDTNLTEAKRKLAVGLAELDKDWDALRKGGGGAVEAIDTPPMPVSTPKNGFGGGRAAFRLSVL
jgi:hypothetical protein